MTAKSKAALKTDIDAAIKTNGSGTITGSKDNVIRTNTNDSMLNIVDGGLVVQALTGYASILTPTDDKHWTPKKWVLDQIAASTPSGVILADGSIPMTGDLDLNSHDLLKVVNIKDPSSVVSIASSTRLLKDASGNTIVNWSSRTNGFGILTGSWAAYLKGTNLSQVSTFEFPDVASGTLAVRADLSAYLPLSGGTLSGNLNGITPTEIGYLSGVTSTIQTQLSAKATDSLVVHLAGTESIAGVKTFSSSPVVPTPTTSTQAANKIYTDNTAIAMAITLS